LSEITLSDRRRRALDHLIVCRTRTRTARLPAVELHVYIFAATQRHNATNYEHSSPSAELR